VLARRQLGHAAVPRIESLAVLPLAIFPRPEQDYFADGMTETLIAIWPKSARFA